ncbi:fibronectin type III domain-containing protein [Gordonia crocea]|uniref:Uncharacterized protein n=1 Tax=Gordonia crocea TaxID=589162 RepID=A0A7I9UUR6_9ACTN|nr:fibronectin type III domain-containing protein [Gordonia crocea]GED96878.1 hypothetical protein nbrc107697_09170 [Gordonia crocea]
MKPRFSWRTVALLAAALVTALVAYGGVRFLSPGGSAPAAPTGLELTVGVGNVSAKWQSVTGADRYLLLRGDEVVYAGAEPHGTDVTVTKGRQTYRVQAIARGVSSALSEPRTTEAGEGWGVGAPLVALFPKLLPPAPKTEAQWRGLRCNWQIRPGRNELGPSEHGAGSLGMRYRLICAADMVLSLHTMWFTSKDAVDGYMSKVIRDSQALRWNHGSGFWLGSTNEGYLKFDDPKLSLVVIGIAHSDNKPGSRSEFLTVANDLPI